MAPACLKRRLASIGSLARDLSPMAACPDAQLGETGGKMTGDQGMDSSYKDRIGDVAEIMLDYVENGKTFQTDKIMKVPTRSYTDPDQWGAEIELIFKRVPLMLALTCELPKPGDYKATEA